VTSKEFVAITSGLLQTPRIAIIIVVDEMPMWEAQKNFGEETH
jgi:hypothetical protein